MVCFSSLRLLFCPEPLKSTPFPSILFSVCKALYISVFCRLLRSLSYFFIFLFKKLLFFPSAAIFSIILLPLGFLLSFSSLCLSLILPQILHSCFCLSKLCFFLLHGGRSGKVKWIFLLWTPKNAPTNTSKPCRGELAWVFQHFQNLQQQLMKVWLMLAYQRIILKRCCSFPPKTLSSLPQQTFIFTPETQLHTLKLL